MPETCFSTAPSVTTGAAAIDGLDRPSAISSEHLALARGELGERPSRRGGRAAGATTSGSIAVPPAATRRTASTKSATSATRSLSR